MHQLHRGPNPQLRLGGPVNETRAGSPRSPSREWTSAMLDVGLDEIILQTPCCLQLYTLGAYHWDSGLTIICKACGTPYDVIFEGSPGQSGYAGWSIR
jgi:hypothetical protein